MISNLSSHFYFLCLRNMVINLEQRNIQVILINSLKSFWPEIHFKLQCLEYYTVDEDIFPAEKLSSIQFLKFPWTYQDKDRYMRWYFWQFPLNVFKCPTNKFKNFYLFNHGLGYYIWIWKPCHTVKAIILQLLTKTILSYQFNKLKQNNFVDSCFALCF